MAVSHSFHAILQRLAFGEIAIIYAAILTTETIPTDNHGGNLGYFFI